MSERENTMIVESADQLMQPASRRKFLRMLGVGGTVVLMPSIFTACNNNDDVTGTNQSPPPPPPAAYTLNLSNDTGILNYAYALEQLEAAYYTAVLTSPGFAGLTADQQEVLTDLQKHEVIHREFFKTVLGASAIPAIGFNATTVATLTATSTVILSTSQLLEDTGVSAYNGAGKYLTTPANLVVAGKIVSVEARHAAAIRDARDIQFKGNTGLLFAGDDVVNSAGLDVKLEPSDVIAAVGGLNVLTSPVTIGTQPATKAGTANMAPPTPN